MPKRSAREGGSPAPYTKQKKQEYRYDAVPLHDRRRGGLTPTPENIARWNERHGLAATRSRG